MSGSRGSRWVGETWAPAAGRGSLLIALAVSAGALGCGSDEPPSDDEQGTDDGASEGGTPPNTSPWEMAAEDLPGALFSVWGSAADDVWVVGSDSGEGPTVLHYDGERWETLDTGATGDLWWVSGRGDDVWMSGARGLVLRYSKDEAEFETYAMPDPVTVFGIYPVASDDVWAVGGDFAGQVSRAVYRFDGQDWAAVTDLPQAPAAGSPPFFKVWGRSSEDLWIVGFGTEALHRVGEQWEVIPIPTERRLFTVHGNDDYVAAVGGAVSGLLVEEQAGEFEDATPEGMPQMNGIWVKPDGEALAVGVGGEMVRRRRGQWALEADIPATAWDYHAVYIDPDGGEWAVGGQVIAPPYTSGMLAHRGPGLETAGLGD